MRLLWPMWVEVTWFYYWKEVIKARVRCSLLASHTTVEPEDSVSIAGSLRWRSLPLLEFLVGTKSMRCPCSIRNKPLWYLATDILVVFVNVAEFILPWLFFFKCEKKSEQKCKVIRHSVKTSVGMKLWQTLCASFNEFGFYFVTRHIADVDELTYCWKRQLS